MAEEEEGLAEGQLAQEMQSVLQEELARGSQVEPSLRLRLASQMAAVLNYEYIHVRILVRVHV